MGGTECSSATPAAEGVPHGGMGGARTEIYRDRTHPHVISAILREAAFEFEVYDLTLLFLKNRTPRKTMDKSVNIAPK